MFLKALTLKGFKSFADKTTLEFEPGVTVVVGPNGSGKSNIVDSVAWVLGAQAARALRGGKMDDVIFAGTAERPALGRAEVSLTIDNSAQLLPIEFSEVTITRTLFRSGESEYMINGAPCRLLDIQELLSDTGIGRQQHVIVGQGQLDTVLNARPEDRRAIIEEAAGVLKFRKRREKSQRRLEATEGNLLRLTDLLREVRRQLRPLERQADAARRHDGLVGELRAIQLHLMGREIESLQTREARRGDERGDFTTRQQDLRGQLRGLDEQVLDAERALSRPGNDDVADILTRTEALRERARGLVNLVAERLRGMERELAAVADEGVVETLVAEAANLREQLTAAGAEAAALDLTALDVAEAERIAAADGDADSASVDAGRRLQQLDQGRHELALAREQLAAVARELYALAPQIADADEAEQIAGRVRTEIDQPGDVAPDMTAEAQERRRSEDALQQADAAWRAAETEASRWHARAETLTLALDHGHHAAGGAAIAAVDGVVGPLVDHVHIEAGAEIAVAAALGDALHAIVVEGDTAARAAVERLKHGETQALLLVVDAGGGSTQAVFAPAGARPFASCVRGTRPGLDRVLARLLAPYVLVDGGWTSALDVALASPGVVAVTREGDRFGGASVWRAGPPGSSAVTPAALAEANAAMVEAKAASEDAAQTVELARQRLAAARRAELVAAERDRQRRMELDRCTARAAQLRREVEVRAASLEERQSTLRLRVAELEALVATEPDAAADARATVERAEQSLARRTEAARLRRDFEVRSAAIAERRSVLRQRLADVDARLAAHPDEEAHARARRSQLESRRDAVQQIATRLADRAGEIERLAERLRRRRQEQSTAAREAGRRLNGLRAERTVAETQLGEVRERASRLEIEEAEIRLRLEQAIERLRHDFDCEPHAALQAPVPETPDGMTLSARARELERELRLMGPVNPLALSEYEALLERHEFLQQQLDDVKNTRRDLARVIKAVDEEIVTVFEAAFADVAGHFSELFAMLFSDGSARLVLTDPHDMLNTGIEMEARPSGKMVRRLSLLSGGERSLTALAYLFAVFRARPSPFYLMDEVEAALDDVNLHRFLDLLHEFRTEAQLLVVSHQKRTMEAADVLYGVSMPPGGSSRVVSQRMRDLVLLEDG
ncbi:MAG: chromosome segregation protein SMC [Actinomycetota bacterium]